jgi:site-specific recombinase XerD
MAYSIKAEAGKPDKNMVVKIYVLVIFKREKFRIPTNIKVNKKHWNGVSINSGIGKEQKNIIVKDAINTIELKLIEAMKFNPDLGISDVKTLLTTRGTKHPAQLSLSEFANSYRKEIETIQSHASIKQLKSTIKFIENNNLDSKLSSIDLKWMNKLELFVTAKYSEPNTRWSLLKRIKAIIGAAAKNGLIPENMLNGFKMPRYEQKLPEYLTEAELKKIEKFLSQIQKPGHQLAGYYFLLSAYAGYRISDLKQFDYEKMVTKNMIVLKAKKNGQIVSMPIHTRLKKVLNFIKGKPLYLSEPKVREYVREIISYVGIKKHIKIHTARHTFAMLCIDSGIDVYTVSELLGNTLRSTQIYARISNQRIKQEVLNKLG